MNETIDEKVSVLTLYDQQKGEAVPVKIKWKTKTYSINQIGMHYTKREGRDLHHIFCVTSGGLAFKLNLSTENLHWVLEEISDGLTA